LLQLTMQTTDVVAVVDETTVGVVVNEPIGVDGGGVGGVVAVVGGGVVVYGSGSVMGPHIIKEVFHIRLYTLTL
jgi:hypothetical protein